MNKNGPAPMSRQRRLELCQEIAERLHAVYSSTLLAIGVYGSVSRGTDGPYSDIEMFCVLRDSEHSSEADFSYEWSAGPWKAEVDVRSADVMLRDARTIEGTWPLTHSPYFSQLSLYDPEGFFPTLKAAAESPPNSEFRRAVQEVIVGEMYEFAGKLRNAGQYGTYAYLPYLTMQFAQYGAMIIGLHNRTRYSTGALVLTEALELPERPAGFDPVTQLVMSGQLSEPAKLISACEQLWSGLIEWAAEHGYDIDSARIPF